MQGLDADLRDRGIEQDENLMQLVLESGMVFSLVNFVYSGKRAIAEQPMHISISLHHMRTNSYVRIRSIRYTNACVPVNASG